MVYVFEVHGDEQPTFAWSGRVPTKKLTPTRLRWDVRWLADDLDGSEAGIAVETPMVTWVLP